jgi:hypothetical protein
MSRVVRVAGRMVELSGLHGIWRGADHLCNSRITLFYINNKPTEVINYGCNEHIQAEKDKLTLEEAKKEFLKEESLLKLR